MPLDKLLLNLDQTRGQVAHLTQQLGSKEHTYKQLQAYLSQRAAHSTTQQPNAPLLAADPHPKRPKHSTQQKVASSHKLRKDLAEGTLAVKKALEETHAAQQQEGAARGEQPTPSHEDPKVLDSYKRRLQFEARQR